MDSTTMDEEEYLRRELAALQESYQYAAAPIMNRLAKIEASKPPKPLVLIAGDGTELHIPLLFD
jgi:hypothetical protein